MEINPNAITVFAETNFRNQRRKFGIKIDDRRRHMYLVGKTGMGKSTTLENMVVADIRAGNGVALVDPHGDLAEKILQFIPNERVNDVVYFNPCDTQYPIAFNILETIGPDYKHLVAYGLVGVFKKIWADSWGPRMEYIMTNTILALLDYPGSTLLGMMRMLVDKGYRKKVLAKITDPVVKTFWADEFANYSEKFRTEAIAPIQNKVGQFLSSAIIRNIVGQSKSTIEMRKIMDERKILIMNLAKGRIGEENSALLGAMMITKLQIAAMSRVDIPEEERKDFYLYVDEFQNFATDSFAGILSEARKYRLSLIMAHQYFEQLNDVVRAAVFGNVGTLIIFRVGATDAAELELEFSPQFLPLDIVNLKKYTFCIRLMVDGVATEPFSGIGLPPVTGLTNNSEKVIRVSRERYARPQAQVEERIIRWSGVEVARPQGQDSAAEAGTGTIIEDEQGDFDEAELAEMKTEVRANKAAKAATQAAVTAESINQKSAQSSNSRQSNEDELTGRLRVNAASMIPDDHLSVGTRLDATTAQVEKPAGVVSQTLAAAAAAAGEIKPRPKIDFVQMTVPEEPATSTKAETEIATEEDEDDFEDDDVDNDEAENIVVAAPPVVAPAAKSQPATTPTSPTSLGEKNNPAGSPAIKTVSTATPTISLRDLQTGNAPQVAFKASSPSGNNSPDQGRKRKRKRKHRSGGGNGNDGGGSTGGNYSGGQSSTPVGQGAPPNRPAMNVAPKPRSAVAQPPRPQTAPPRQPNHQPVNQSQPAPQPAPTPRPAAPDTSKISFTGLI